MLYILNKTVALEAGRLSGLDVQPKVLIADLLVQKSLRAAFNCRIAVIKIQKPALEVYRDKLPMIDAQ